MADPEKMREIFMECMREYRTRMDSHLDLLLGERERTIQALRPVMHLLPERQGFRYVSEDVEYLVMLLMESQDG